MDDGLDDRILEPLSAYNNGYAREFAQNTLDMFDALVRQSGVDATQNKSTVKKYETELSRKNAATSKIGKLKTYRGLLIALIVIGAISVVVGILLLVGGTVTAGAILLAVGVAFVLLGAVIIPVKIRPALGEARSTEIKHEKAANKLLAEAQKQMAPLNALFDDNMTKRLIQKTVPLIKIDDNFDLKRYDYLSGKYGFGGDSGDRSTIGILSGEILGNPFVIDRELVHTMGSQTYTGTLVITWTETRIDSEGHPHTEHHSQTLVATVIKPKPFYHAETRLIYGNDAAPDLNFSRKPSHAEKLNEKQLERTVKSGMKKIREIQENKQGFTEMGNEQFDVLFDALDRNNEVQFRLLFTPLAQKNMLALIRDNEHYGDDFTMRKSGCLNYISSEHSASWDPETSPEHYYSYSLEKSKQNFVNFNNGYFRSLFFDFAPLLAIPLYQQQKPKEYIYHETYDRNFTRHESEYAVNNIGEKVFAPENAATNCILKTRPISMNGKSDKVRVSAYSYCTQNRVDFVPTFGGDGRMHNVPVPWVEYIPVSREKTVMLKELGLSHKEFATSPALQDAIKRHNCAAFGYGHGILCCVTDDDSNFDSEFMINKN